MRWVGRGARIGEKIRKKREEKTKREEEGKKRRRETVSYSDYSVKTIGNIPYG
jgi:hypothetical protein